MEVAMEKANREMLAEYLRHATQRQGLTQKEIATRLGLERSSIAKVFAGEIKSKEPYERIARLFGYGLEEALENARRVREMFPSQVVIEEAEHEAYVITIATEKGGSSKTTTTVALAYEIARRGHRILVVDLDQQGDTTKHVGITEGNHGQNLAEVLRQVKPLEELEIHETEHGMDILPGGRYLATCRADLSAVVDGSQLLRVRQVLEPLLPDYDFIIIDAPPTSDIIQGNALAAADGVISPVKPEGFGFDGFFPIIESVKRMRLSVNPDLEYLGTFLTVYDKRVSISRETALELRRVPEVALFEPYVRTDVSVAEAQRLCVPVAAHKPKCRAAVDYRALVTSLLERIHGD